jgi:hypothetical protein
LDTGATTRPSTPRGEHLEGEPTNGRSTLIVTTDGAGDRRRWQPMTDYRQLQKDALTAAGGDRVEATLRIENALVSAEANDDGHAAFQWWAGRESIRQLHDHSG